MELTRDTRIIDMTLGQFEDWMKSKGFKPAEELKQEKRLVYGYAGVMDLFNCSHTTAYRLMNGVIRDAVSKQGRTIVIDADLALKLFKNL